MAKCVYKKRQDVVICSSAFNKPIILQKRNLKAPTNFDDDVDYSEEFTVSTVFWAMIETVTGSTIFDESNIKQTFSHKFYIRYTPDITSEYWVVYENKRYKILNVENINEQNQYLLLRCTIRGNASLPVNEQ